MTRSKDKRPASSRPRKEHEALVVSSALWAAAGDALGWMTELSRDRNNVRHRTGADRVEQPVDWRRLVGGRGGVTVELPSGTYSDDTQLRMCVSRSIRGDGSFDVETFAKVELTVWQGYSLGAGIGSKAAALNLSKRGVNWFSNFFTAERQKYTSAGGNGAAMRIQPHVWSARSSMDEMLISVFRDSIVTHGHPHGFGGALFHALCLWDTLCDGELPSMDKAGEYLSIIRRLPEIIANDSELFQFWLPSWERESGSVFRESLDRFAHEAHNDIVIASDILARPSATAYVEALERLGCLSDRYRGSGFKTALSALIISHLYKDGQIENALRASANEIRSDTDTIATMAGALLGAMTQRLPDWPIQDRLYLESEALRLALISTGVDQTSFRYPDVSTWEAPSNQSDTVMTKNGSLVLIGLGQLTPKGEGYHSGGFVWQWFDLPFGQSILAKRRKDVAEITNESQLPWASEGRAVKFADHNLPDRQERFAFDQNTSRSSSLKQPSPSYTKIRDDRFPGIDKATDIIISSGFDDTMIGKLLNQCIEETGSIELAASLTAIIAKAKLTRMRRR